MCAHHDDLQPRPKPFTGISARCGPQGWCQCVETLVCAAKIAGVVNVPAVARKKVADKFRKDRIFAGSSLDKVQEQLIEDKMMFASAGLS